VILLACSLCVSSHPTVVLAQVLFQCVAVCCSVLHCVAVCCSVLQSVAECCIVSQYGKHTILFACFSCIRTPNFRIGSGVFQFVAVCCRVLQSVAVCRSESQCVAVRGTALQCVIVSFHIYIHVSFHIYRSLFVVSKAHHSSRVFLVCILTPSGRIGSGVVAT